MDRATRASRNNRIRPVMRTSIDPTGQTIPVVPCVSAFSASCLSAALSLRLPLWEAMSVTVSAFSVCAGASVVSRLRSVFCDCVCF